MRAIFALTPSQINKAAMKAEEVRAEMARVDKQQQNYNKTMSEQYSSWSYQNHNLISCGLYLLETHAATNVEQGVYLVEENQEVVLVVEGHRCALMQDGGFKMAEGIVGRTAVPLRYETSDARLKWNETLAGFLHQI